MIWDQKKMDYLAHALCANTWKYPGMRLDHDGFYEISGIVIDALNQYEQDKPYEIPNRLFEIPQ